MPSFDVVSEVESHALTNAVDQAQDIWVPHHVSGIQIPHHGLHGIHGID